MRSKRSFLLAVVVNLSLVAAAHAGPHGIYWAAGKKPVKQSGEGPTKLLYYGGPVISNANVYAVFWGSQVSPETKAKIGPFFANILDSTYMDWLSEYDTNVRAVDGRAGTNQHIGRGNFSGSTTIMPSRTSRNLTDRDVQLELEEQIAAGRLAAPDDNSLYMIYFPSGVSIVIEDMRSCSTFCAYHEGFKSKTGASVYYGVMPVCGFGCGGSSFDSLSAVSSHEALEAITDPFPTPGSNPAYPQAWNTSTGEEVADLCASGGGTVTGHGVVSRVSEEWSNLAGACIRGPWTQSSSLAAAPARWTPAPLLQAMLSAAPAARWDGR